MRGGVLIVFGNRRCSRRIKSAQYIVVVLQTAVILALTTGACEEGSFPSPSSVTDPSRAPPTVGTETPVVVPPPAVPAPRCVTVRWTVPAFEDVVCTDARYGKISRPFRMANECTHAINVYWTTNSYDNPWPPAPLTLSTQQTLDAWQRVSIEPEESESRMVLCTNETPDVQYCTEYAEQDYRFDDCVK